MEMGKLLRAARLEAGLSQTQLSKDLISRNMLSLIESGSAKPSLSTLEELAKRLHKPVGYFFGETADLFSGRGQVEKAWEAYENGSFSEAARLLSSIRGPERFHDLKLLKTLVLIHLADQAIRENRAPYAGEMLLWAEQEGKAFPELMRTILLTKGRLEDSRKKEISQSLPSLDPELQLRAEGALEEKDPFRAARLLDAAEDQKDPCWAMLRGRAYLLEGHVQNALRCFHQAEQAFPRETAPYLERCYRELEDFKKAYFYACRQK